MRSRTACLSLALCASVTGCYSLHPVDRSALAIGSEFAFDLNDVGRVGLGQAIGAEVAQVQGTLSQQSGDALIVSVSEVHTLRGATLVWKGEPVAIRPEYFSTLYAREYSKTRTFLLAAGALAAGVFIGSRTFGGGGTEDPVAPPPIGSSIRIP